MDTNQVLRRDDAGDVDSDEAVFPQWIYPRGPIYDCVQLDCMHPSRDSFGGASSTMRSADGESHRDCPAPATATRVVHSALPAADRAQPYPPRVHYYRVGCALCNADGESHSPAHATVLRAARSAWPAAVRAQPARAHIPGPALVCGARCLRIEGGTRTLAHVSARPSSVLSDIRGALHGRHPSVSAPLCPCVRGALYALRAARARDRPPPPGAPRHAGHCRERALLLVCGTHACPLPPPRCAGIF